jgi:hypothetical protein
MQKAFEDGAFALKVGELSEGACACAREQRCSGTSPVGTPTLAALLRSCCG